MTEVRTDLCSVARLVGSGTSPALEDEFTSLVAETAHLAFNEGDTAAELSLHQFLYEINAHAILPPWDKNWRDYENPTLIAAHQQAQDAWLAHDVLAMRARLATPTEPTAFAAWAIATCENHASGPTHPLFVFLAERATFGQLTTFLGQESPFDMHFGDLISLLLPGVHGEQKTELAGNFWDEMGKGRVDYTHRRLRLDMMERVGIAVDGYLRDIGSFWVEELRLANMYFHAAGSRRLAPQAVGMLLATELVVPGRIDRQIDGWRRLGLTDDELHYLCEHVTVDVEHAKGWLDHVVLPLAQTRPDLLPEVGLGILRRLDAALHTCDRAMKEFESAT